MMGTNEKRMVRILQAAVLLLSVPMIVIAFYSHPSVDDYGYGISDGNFKSRRKFFE